jgi:hypothetical protein
MAKYFYTDWHDKFKTGTAIANFMIRMIKRNADGQIQAP